MSGTLPYRLPALWNCWGFSGAVKRIGREILVDPLEYSLACLEWITQQSDPGLHYAGNSLAKTLPQSRKRPRRGVQGGDWITRECMYAMFVRMTTAWDHDGDGKLTGRRHAESGTFLKSILLMPLLKKMGVSVLYLLPVVKVSNLYRKGQLGCPYATRNFFELDPAQHDPLFERSPEHVADEFGVFVEAAHRLGMRVMLDIAPRTSARDCDWIIDHPEWFYWIDHRELRRYGGPRLTGVDYGNPVPGRLGDYYHQPAVRDHLARFRFAPNLTHPREWKRFVADVRRRRPDGFMADIVERFGVTTAPAFSDVINDPQPPWSDVTYLRLYLDHAPEAARHLPAPSKQPPYVLFDTIKCNLFPGRRPNRELWKQLASILPFYQQFGIDGARVDMAHALPPQLEHMILDGPRRRDPDFCLLAEDLGYHNHVKARKAGYNMVIGPSWWMQPRAAEGHMHEMLADLPGLKVAVMAAAETPDTPRAAVRAGGRDFARQAVVMNMFLPNAVPMINSGMEVFERQPMNLGLDTAHGPGRFALPKRDPQYGKLAFFDAYALHWNNAGGAEMVELIGRASAIRAAHLDAITDPKAYFAPKLTTHAKRILATGFRLPKPHRGLLMLANVDFDKPHRATVTGLPASSRPEALLELTQTAKPRMAGGRLSVALGPGDVKVIRF